MTSVLVVDDDDVFRGDLAQELRAHGYEVTEADNVQDAASALRTCPPDVMLTDLRMKGCDGIDLLSQARELAPATLPILMSGFATAEDYQRAVDLGAVRVLTKPFTPDEMLGAVAHALDCGTGFHGSVHGVSLLDMLQMFHFGRRTVSLHVGSAREGTIEFCDGEIVHAVHASLVGVEALRRILETPSGAMSTSVRTGEPPVTITEPFQSLLMDTLRGLDEDTRPEQVPLDACMDDAFQEWASLRPAALEQRDAERLRALGPVLERVAPQLGAAVVDELSARVIALRHFAERSEWVGVTRSLHHDVARLTADGTYHQFEYVGAGIAFALIRNAEQRYTLVLDTTLLDRFAAQRFRSQVRQVMSYLPGAHKNEERIDR